VKKEKEKERFRTDEYNYSNIESTFLTDKKNVTFEPHTKIKSLSSLVIKNEERVNVTQNVHYEKDLIFV
jgi:hypothetical protein